jgi:hypothetical protein
MANPTVIFDQDQLLAKMPAKLRAAVKKMDADQLRPIYLSIAKRLEPIVEGYFYAGATSSGGRATAKWGKGTVRSLRETVDAFPNKANKEKAYAVVGPHKMYVGANRGTPAHNLFLTGERSKRGARDERRKLVTRFKRGDLSRKLSLALSIKGMTQKYPMRPAYDRANQAAGALYAEAFSRTDAKVVDALRTEFTVQ